MFLYILKRTDDDAPNFFQSCPVSNAFNSVIQARLTYRRALPLPPSSCCPLCYYKERPAVMSQVFSKTVAPRRSTPYTTGAKYYRTLPFPSSPSMSFLFSFCFTFVIYKFKNVSVRKCLIVQLAKFLMQLISISTNSLNEMNLSLRPIISTATRQ